MHRHIAVLLMTAVFSLTMHVGVYHIPVVDSDHAQEQDHGHTDSDTCIAGLVHAQLSVEQATPTVAWLLVGIVSPLIETNFQNGLELLHTGRAPPCANTTITV